MFNISDDIKSNFILYLYRLSFQLLLIKTLIRIQDNEIVSSKSLMTIFPLYTFIKCEEIVNISIEEIFRFLIRKKY